VNLVSPAFAPAIIPAFDTYQKVTQLVELTAKKIRRKFSSFNWVKEKESLQNCTVITSCLRK
jgi:hypothetical protein